MTTTTRRPVSPRTDLVGALAELDEATADARPPSPRAAPPPRQPPPPRSPAPGRPSPVGRRALPAPAAAHPAAPVLAGPPPGHAAADLAVASAARPSPHSCA